MYVIEIKNLTEVNLWNFSPKTITGITVSYINDKTGQSTALQLSSTNITGAIWVDVDPETQYVTVDGQFKIHSNDPTDVDVVIKQIVNN